MARQKIIEKPAKWMPSIGAVIPIHLPNEIVLGHVVEYKNDDTMLAKLDKNPPMSKAHGYFFRATVELHRVPSMPTGERWVTKEVLENLE